MAEVPALAESADEMDLESGSEATLQAVPVQQPNRFDAQNDRYRSNDVLSGFLGLPMLRQFGLLIGFASIITFCVLILMWSQSPDYRPLYSNLEASEASSIARVLEEAGIDFSVEPDSGMILVPVGQIHDARMKVAAADVISTRESGYFILDQEQELGMSQFMENARYQRAIEGELAKTISSLKNVRNARVLLAIPKQSVFVRDNRKPSASVFVELTAGREMEHQQVKSIMHLVAHSIPEMSKENVTVVDQHGSLLSDFEDTAGLGESEKQFQFSQKIGDELREKIEKILQPVLGDTRFNAEVAADVDFTFVEQTAELYNPELSAIRSEETVEDLRAAGEDGGIPGALANQPPGPVEVPEVGLGGANGEPGSVMRQRRQATRNYELDRTISHTRHSVGKVTRLTVAVVLDNMQVLGESGDLESVPWDASSLTSITQLIRDAVGYDESRGDRVTVINEAFMHQEDVVLTEPSFWTEAWFLTLMKQAMFGVLVVFLTFFVLRPVLNMLAGPSAEDRMKDLLAEQELERLAEQELEQEEEMMQETVTLSGGEELLLPGPGDLYGRQLDAIRALVDENPARVAQVVKEWVVEA